MARRMPVSYTGPREDVSLKALGGYAPSALQTDILPRSSIGDSYNPLLPESPRNENRWGIGIPSGAIC